MLRAHLENDSLPWTNAAISGWVLDPDRKKMSKSKGNVVTPMALLEEYGSDGVRYWAARGGPGVDTAFDAGQMKIGRKLAMKLLNVVEVRAGRGAAGGRGDLAARPRHAANLAALVDDATAELERYEYAKALREGRGVLLGLLRQLPRVVKSAATATGPSGAASANSAMSVALSVMLRLFAPYLPFVCRGGMVVVAGRAPFTAPPGRPGEVMALCRRR